MRSISVQITTVKHQYVLQGRREGGGGAGEAESYQQKINCGNEMKTQK